MTLLVRPHLPDTAGVVIDITPASANWTYVGFRIVKLAAGERYSATEAGREACLVLLSGVADVRAADRSFAGIGSRASVFDGPPVSVYIPADLAYEICATGAVDLAICTAPASAGRPVHLIAPEDVGGETRGRGTNTRHVRNILPQESSIAECLLVVEVITPGGHWSSYPPHKHDMATATETRLEETYYHRMRRPGGFAIQRVYTDDRSLDETLTVQDGDAVLVPRGYHPVSAAHGYDLYYLNVMAGPERAWRFTNDPAHDWIMREPS